MLFRKLANGSTPDCGPLFAEIRANMFDKQIPAEHIRRHYAADPPSPTGLAWKNPPAIWPLLIFVGKPRSRIGRARNLREPVGGCLSAGSAGFGQLSFCSAVTGYFILFADYGFNFSATRQIALHSHDRAGRSKVFWNTLVVKGLLAGAGFPCLLVLTLIVDKFAAERGLLLINYLTVVGTVLTPTWYFQGTERQTVLSSITIVVRLLSVPAIFLLVRTRNDLHLAAWISSGVAGGSKLNRGLMFRHMRGVLFSIINHPT